MVATPEELADEARRARKMRHIVDIATNFLMQSDMSHQDAIALVRWVRQWILELFPDGEHTYELIYAPRFTRLIREYVDRRDVGCRVVVIRFHHPAAEA